MSQSLTAPRRNALRRLETRLEELVDGLFRARGQGVLQPVEIAGQLTTHAEGRKMISLNHAYVPSRYIVTVHPEDMEVLRTFAEELQAELSRHVADWVAEHQYSVSGPVRVELRAGDHPLRGRFSITSAWSRLPTTAEAEEPTGECPELGLGEAVGQLEGIAGPDMGSVFPLFVRQTILGRGPDCHVQLRDSLISRQHAVLDPRADGWVVQDLKSTNGTWLNERPVVGEARLREGDLLKLGGTVLRVSLQPVSRGGAADGDAHVALAQRTA